jgi:predicted RNA-binding Zn ribbon-like protein
MTVHSASSRTEPPEFRFIGGDPSVDFVNTADWQEETLLLEAIPDYDALVRWAVLGGVIDQHAAGMLRSRAHRDSDAAEQATVRARELRDVIHRAFLAVAHSGPAMQPVTDLVRTAIESLDVLLGDVLPHMRLHTEHGRPALGWKGMGVELDCITWPIVWSATQLVVSDSIARIRVCAGMNCGWMYVDTSRNGLRRWCRMEGCGARDKARRHYARVKTQRADAAPRNRSR